MDMNAENRTWNISVRSRKDQDHVIAAKVREEGGKLVFTDIQGAFKGSCYLTDVQGYSVEPPAPVTTKPQITVIVDSPQVDLDRSLADDAHAGIWNVSVRSKKEQHHVVAANVKEDDGKLIFTDLQGELAGCFCLTEVQSWLVATAPPGITVIVDGAPGE